MNPRFSCSVTTAWHWDLGQCIEAWVRLGIPAIGVTRLGMEKYGVQKAIKAVRESGLKVSSYQGVRVSGMFDKASYKQSKDEECRALDTAAAIGADCVYLITGPRGALSWEEAAKRTVAMAEVLLEEAKKRDLRIALEPVHPMRQDLTFVNTAADAYSIVKSVNDKDFGYVFDCWHLWWSRDVMEVIKQSAKKMFAVQLDDHKPHSNRTMDRAMLGKGIIPLKELLTAIERGGYRGYYDVEIIADDLQQMGYEPALKQIVSDFDRLWTQCFGAKVK
jgi:sugar phosphate isomerase/epimerase